MATMPLSPAELALDTGPEQNAITTALLALATFFVGLRLWARWVVGAGFGRDDWCTVASLIVTVMLGGINYAMVGQGLGKHFAALSGEQMVNFLKLLLAFECVYVTAVALVKISVLLMFLRLFPSRGFKNCAYVLAGLTVAWWLAIVCVCLFQCDPIPKAWMPLLPGTCIDLKASFIGNAIPNIMTDIAILCLPIYQVIKLKLSRAQRLSVCFMFALGGFVLFASIYRFTTIMQFEIADTTWTLATPCTWCVVEAGCGVISACLPTLRPLVVKFTSQCGSVTSRLGHSGGGGKSSKSSGGGSGSIPFSNKGSKGGRDLVTIGGGGGGGGVGGANKFQRLDDDSSIEMGLGVRSKVVGAEAQAAGAQRPLSEAVDFDLPMQAPPAGAIRVDRDVRQSRERFY